MSCITVFVKRKIKIDYESEGAYLYNYSRDLSEGGIFIQTSNPLKIGDRLTLNFGLRMEALLERELTYAEERQPGAIEGASLDNLSKLGSLVVKFRAQESNNGVGYDKAKVFLENIQWIVAWLQENDPEGLKILATDFDAMTMKFKAECLSGSTNA